MQTAKFLAGSPYHLEYILGHNLAERAKNGQLTHLLLNQPPVCNSHCRRCFMPNNRRNKIIQPLTSEESCKIINNAAQLGFLCLEISGEGEPLLSKNIDEIVRCAHKNKLITTIITNGHALTKEKAEFFFQHNVSLIISLFSIDEKQYEMDNGVSGSYHKVMRNLRTAANIFQNGKMIKNNAEIFRIAVHTTAQTDNLNRLKAIREFCAKEDIFFSVAPLASVGGGSSMPGAFLTQDEEELLERLGDNSIILSGTSERETGRQVCGTCLYGLNISYNGDILFDAHAGYDIEGRLGSVRTSTISELVQRQRKFAPFLFKKITGYCPVRDPAWPEFMANISTVPGIGSI